MQSNLYSTNHMHETQHALSLETCQVLLAELDPSSRFVSVRPMGADGTNPAFVIEARTAVCREQLRDFITDVCQRANE